MAENIAGTSEEKSRTGLNWRSLASLSASCFFAWLSWRLLGLYYNGRGFYVSLIEFLGMAALHALLTLFLERGFLVLPLQRAWRYRLAFSLSAGLALLFAVFHWAIGLSGEVQLQSFVRPLLGVVAGMVGAFLGGLVAVALHQSLWENNSPPPEAVASRVHQLHRRIIGLPAPEKVLKRAFDLLLSLLGIILSMPVWMAGAFLVWFEDPGPVLFIKNSVGKGGINFHQFKFRTMVSGAESGTGPVLASESDARVLRVGHFLRKTALDELPQLINILIGEMSFVGPRPQRTVLVHDYLLAMPEYAERHLVLPGLAGLAQVAGDYYLTPRQKLRFDRLYIRYASLGFDLKLLLLAFLITFWFRWQEGWNGRLPRRLLRFGARRRPDPPSS